MKKLLLISLFSLFLSLSFSSAKFIDIRSNSPLVPYLDYLSEKNLLEQKGFFRSDFPAPEALFWSLVLPDSGLKTEENTLAEAVKRFGFFAEEAERAVSDTENFLTMSQAIRYLNKAYGIVPNREASPRFLLITQNLKLPKTILPELEATYASGMINRSDLFSFRPTAPLLRRDLVRWMYHYNRSGRKKQSGLEKTSAKIIRPSRGEKRETVQIRISKPTPKSKENLIMPNGVILQDVFAEVLRKYEFPEELTREKKEAMVEAAMEAMIKELGDKYSNYIRPNKSEEFLEDLEGKFEGIGAFVELVDHRFTIISPITGSPAEKAGILPGDIVTHVDGESIKDVSINESVKKIRGEAGTVVRLTIERTYQSNPIEISVTRGKIEIPSITVQWRGSIPIIGIHQFTRDTIIKLQAIINQEILPRKPLGIILDLRRNPGGLLTSAVSVGSLFLKKDQVVFKTEARGKIREYKATSDGTLSDFSNIVILQDGGTASASEIVITTLQDHRGVVVIGKKSVGKGTVQEIRKYNHGGALKLTIAKWKTPKDRWIHDEGIEPDIVMESQTSEQRLQSIDPVIDRAVQEIQRR